MALVDGLDGYLAASTLNLAARGESNARAASRMLGILVVLFAFGLGGAELIGYEINQFALPLGLALFAIVISIRVWARSSKPEGAHGPTKDALATVYHEATKVHEDAEAF